MLHYSMIIQETPLSTSEIVEYINEGIILINNEDFDKYIANNLNLEELILDDNYSVIEL